MRSLAQVLAAEPYRCFNSRLGMAVEVSCKVKDRVTCLIHEGSLSSLDGIFSILEDVGLAWRAQIQPCAVACWDENRSGLIVTPSAAHSLGARIVKQGWSWLKAASATCIQLPEDPCKKQEILDKNLILFGTHRPPCACSLQ